MKSEQINLIAMAEEDFEEFEISQLCGLAVLPSYMKTTVITGVDGDEPRLPKILSKKSCNNPICQIKIQNNQQAQKSLSVSKSRSVKHSRQASKELSKQKCKPRQKPNTKDRFLRPKKKAVTNSLQQKFNSKSQRKENISYRKPTVEQLRQQICKKELEQCTFQPKISSRGKQKTKTKGMPSTTRQTYKREKVFDRLYKKNKESNEIGISIPNNNKVEKLSRRQSPIEEFLYSDALRRRGRDTLLSRRDFKNSSKNSFNNSMRMQKMAGQRFVKQFSFVLQQQKLHQQKLLSLLEIHKLLVSLNFITTKKLLEDHFENILIYEVFEILGGNIENGVRVKNLLMFLLAINGIFNVQQVNTYQPLKVNIHKVNVESELGLLLTQQGLLKMNQALGTKIHKYFDVMYRNRLSRKKTNLIKGQEKQNQNINYQSKRKDSKQLKSRNSKKTSAATSKRQSQAILTQSKKLEDSKKLRNIPINIPHLTHQTNQSQFSDENTNFDIQKVFNIQNFPLGVTLEIQLKDGITKDLFIPSLNQMQLTVKEFCEQNYLDSDSEEQILLVAKQVFESQQH